MDGCFIEQTKPAIIQCVGELKNLNNEFVCRSEVFVAVKPGPANAPWPSQKLNGTEILNEMSQMGISTRLIGDPIIAGIHFSGYKQGMIERRDANGQVTYAIQLIFDYNDMRMSKDADFRRCQWNGKPLYVSGHIGIATPK